VRTVPVPDWVRSELEVWLNAAGIDRGRLFRRVNEVLRERSWSSSNFFWGTSQFKHRNGTCVQATVSISSQ
jgi:hypothetical protein